MSKGSMFALGAVILAMAAPATLGVVYHYEMATELDLAQPDTSPGMFKVGGGYASAGEIPPAGLQGDGTARFQDTGNFGNNSFYTKQENAIDKAFTIDMRVWGEVACGGGASARMGWICVDSGLERKGRGLRFDPGGTGGNSLNIVFVSAGPVGTHYFPPTTTEHGFHMIRMATTGVLIDPSPDPNDEYHEIYLYDLETPGGPPWNLIGIQQLSGLSGAAISTHANLGLGSNSGSITTAGSFLVDWVRIDHGTTLGADDPIIEGPVEPCLSTVFPGLQQIPSLEGQPYDPGYIDYTVTNSGSVEDIIVGVKEVEWDSDLEEWVDKDYDWVELDKASTATLHPTESEPVRATIDTSPNDVDLTPGLYTAYLQFEDDCDPTHVHTREIQLTVIGCSMTVTPAGLVNDATIGCENNNCIHICALCEQPRDYFFTINNDGAHDFDYTVTPDCGWVTVTNNGSGTLVKQTSIEVTVQLDPSTLTGDDNFCTLTFATSNGCDLTAVRKIVASRVDAGTARIWEYNGNVDPATPDSAGTGQQFVLKDGTQVGEVVEDEGTTDCYAYHINDTSSSKEMWRTQPAENVGSCSGATVVGRVKVLSKIAPSSANLAIFHDGGYSCGYHWGGPDGAPNIKETYRGNEITGWTPEQGADDQYHILRMTGIGGENFTGYPRRITLYFDENPTPVINIFPGASAADSPDSFGFGATSTAGTQNIYFDWMTSTNSGAYAPGEEEPCFGRSFVLTGTCKFCNDPFADADKDTDVDQDDFAIFQLCYTGDEDPGGAYDHDNCRCFNRDDTDDTVPDVDAMDFQAFQNCESAPGIAANPACDGE